MGKTFEANVQKYGYGSEYNLPIHETFEDLFSTSILSVVTPERMGI